MNKKILLVYPENPLTYWSFKYSLKFINKKASMPPLGLLTVAALLPPAYDLKLVDMNVQPLSDKDIQWADIVFVSAMIVQKDAFDKVVGRCIRAGVPVAAGGPYPTSSHSSISGVDYFILGEGEVTIPQFISDYEAGHPAHVYASDEKPDLSLSPVPRYDLIDVNNYASMAIQYSRGCPFSCEFCDIIEMFGRRPRVKPVDKFIAEMDAIRLTGYRGSVFIVDDNFIGNAASVRILLGEIAKWQKKYSFPFTFYTESSINLAGENEILELMVQCSFSMVFLGIETPDSNTLSAINKNQNLKVDVFESIRTIQTRGIEVTAGFIVGFDTDTDDIFDRQVEFIQRAGIPMSMIGILTALPGTKLYNRLKSEGRLLNESNGHNTNKFELNYVPVMEKSELFEGYKRVLKEIYTPGKYFKRTLTLLSRTPAAHSKSHRIEKGDIRALFKSFIAQTFSRYGISYISFLVRAAFLNPENFALAVNMAVKGHHFFTITRITLASDELALFSAKVIDKFRSKIDSKIKRGDIIARSVNRYARHAKREIMRKYRRMTIFVCKFPGAEYEEFITKIDAISELYIRKVLVLNSN